MQPANYAVILSVAILGCQKDAGDTISAQGAATGLYIYTALEPKPDILVGPVIPASDRCLNCSGTGRTGDGLTECRVCGGTGKLDAGAEPINPLGSVYPGTNKARSHSREGGREAVRSPNCTTVTCPVSISSLPRARSRGRLVRERRLFRRRR
jgi:hypothetical protein